MNPVEKNQSTPDAYNEKIKKVLTAEAVRLKALLDGDVTTLDHITADTFIHVDTAGRRRNKAEFLDGITHGHYQFQDFVIDENDVQVFGMTAVVTGRYHNVVRTPAGLQPTKYARHIRVYVQEDGAWRNIAHQATEIRGTNPK